MAAATQPTLQKAIVPEAGAHGRPAASGGDPVAWPATRRPECWGSHLDLTTTPREAPSRPAAAPQPFEIAQLATPGAYAATWRA